jgi:hypothetical protein
MKNSVLFLLSSLLFIACETGYKAEDNSTKLSKNNHKSKPIYIESETFEEKFSGGTISDGLDIGTIRVSYKRNSVRLVFDSYQWNQTSEYLGEKVDKAGSYNFNYDPDKLLITATVNGYSGFSAKLPKFSANSIVEKIYLDEYLDDSGYKFYIKLRYDSNVKVFDLNNPGRIVIDITSL